MRLLKLFKMFILRIVELTYEVFDLCSSSNCILPGSVLLIIMALGWVAVLKYLNIYWVDLESRKIGLLFFLSKKANQICISEALKVIS
ncbi:hypothetical protein RchiOBHm_Chr5g0015141 [Rosa chinensis]|uniref:Uncharacterized protein n=1 Tax=Rosa chinensis TaxID=74649 RepID=A0A2P6Q5U9_ROSCH|nr:hypothetical protein RchiOBHm_Chr5g0015141 [Rosa chinensis]